jgi:hypothetical protein
MISTNLSTLVVECQVSVENPFIVGNFCSCSEEYRLI